MSEGGTLTAMAPTANGSRRYLLAETPEEGRGGAAAPGLDSDESVEDGDDNAGQLSTLGFWGYAGQRAFVGDYISLAVVSVVAVVTAIAFAPFIRPIDAVVLADPDLRHPHRADIIPTWSLFFIALLAPLLCALAINAIAAHRLQLSQRDRLVVSMRNTHRFLLALGFALALTVATTNILKTTIGRFRPDFLDRCQYSAASQDCMGDAALVRDGRMSFPSGHSSFSFAGAVMLMLWTARTLRLYGLRGGSRLVGPVSGSSLHGTNDVEMLPATSPQTMSGNAGNDKPSGLARAGRGYVLLLALVPLWIAGYVAVSRLQQFVHHPTDVIGGSLIGSAISIFVFSAQFW